METLYIVLPCLNEEEILEETIKVLVSKLEGLQEQSRISPDSRILFVDDGSSDGTWDIIKKLHEDNALVNGIRLSRNFGQQNALLAGMTFCTGKCDACITMDADLQDDVDAIGLMLDKYESGCDIVYGVRADRSSDGIFKRLSASCFYRLMNLLGAKQQKNHADFRLLSKRALDELQNFPETNLFLRGLVPMIGLPSATVAYSRKKRTAGRSKYRLGQMNRLAFEGISSFSTKPLKFIKLLGLIVFLASIAMLIWSIVGYFRGTTVAGWASLMVSIWGIGGLLMISLGVVGEYIGKVYLETKGRPRFIIEESLDVTPMRDIQT